MFAPQGWTSRSKSSPFLHGCVASFDVPPAMDSAQYMMPEGPGQKYIPADEAAATSSLLVSRQSVTDQE